MRRVLVIAVRDYNAAVRTKGFLIGLFVLPLMLGGSLIVQRLVRDVADTTPRRYAVIDRTPDGQLVEKIEAAAARRNEKEIFDPETGKQKKPVYEIERVEPSADTAEAILEQRYELSEKVRRRELYGFMEIGALVPRLDSEEPTDSEARALHYYSRSPLSREFSRWAGEVLAEAVQEQRSAKAGVKTETVRAVKEPVPLLSKGLAQRDPKTDKIQDGRSTDTIVVFLLPTGLMVMMFMLIFLGATPLLQGVIEEKTARIAEVLLGSVRPFELMMGKLLGVVGTSLTLAAIYLAAAYGAAHQYGFSEYLTPEVICWFLVYQVLGVLLFGSLFAAIGAASTSLQESQTLLTPVTLLSMIPLFLLVPVLTEPESPLATWLSLLPFATPTVMVARIAIPPGVPWWQPVAGVVMTLATTVACIYAAGRIFRVGILMQGKGARFSDLVRWVVRG